ncbi:MAG TPA: 1-acyl-sn-glycerol-3-phosphate acyltransferase, partial [Pyrinomonadaceae bacterium]|nr:1-acyl-sn-glycerol-3-phosphate acyltransferase [Pyrinomonadaceae bacterium]
AAVYLALARSKDGVAPDLDDAERVFRQLASAGARKLVLVTSAAVYGASPHNTGLLTEATPTPRADASTVCGAWARLEALAAEALGETAARLVVLRHAPAPQRGGRDYFSRLLGGRAALALPGHDPSLQLLDAEDLAEAVALALERARPGTYNVAPDGVVPLRAALRLAGARRVPVPRTLQRAARAALAAGGKAAPAGQLDFIRYSWTISNEKLKAETGFAPRRSSAEAAARFGGEMVNAQTNGRLRFDDFGMDERYTSRYGRTLFAFLERVYWRVEAEGLEHVPREGRAVLAGTHRGFMPFDAVITLNLVGRAAGRYPRFLIHPGLIKFPFLFNFHTKLGGVVACRENADRLLARGELLGIYPEGIRGAFSLYRDAYRLGKFGRDEFARVAIRNRAPIVPFVNVGSAEIFPILARLDWGWWKRNTEWPFFPLTPTWPLLGPLPLPSKWHVRFLPALNVHERYPPEAADDPRAVREVSLEVRRRMEAAWREMLGRRKHIFWGSIFGRGDGEGLKI